MPSEDLLRQIFVKKSLKNSESGFQLQLHNPLTNVTIVEPAKIVVKGESIEKERCKNFDVEVSGGSRIKNKDISKNSPFYFPVNAKVTLYFKRDQPLPAEKFKLKFTFLSEEYGELKFGIKERIRE